MSKVWADQTLTDRAELIVLLAIADYANDEGVAWPSIDSIASKGRLFPRTVFRVLDRLKRAGKISIDSGGGKHQTNRYTIIINPVVVTVSNPVTVTPPVRETVFPTPPNPVFGVPSKTPDPSGTVSDPPKICTKSQKPSMDELKIICKKKGLKESDGEWLFHKWEGNGWRNDGKPIKSYTGTVAQWKIQGIFPSQKSQQLQFRQPPRNQI